MLIADFKRPDGRRERLAIVGSCRVHDPLKAVAKSGLGTFQWSAHNAFTHNPPEAVQHIAFCRGLSDVPDPFAPFILRQDSTPDVHGRLPALIESCETFVVEMSSASYLRCGHYYFSQDYFSQRFARGGGLGVLQWLRELSADPPRETTVQAALQSFIDAGKPVTVSTEEILRSTRAGVLDEETFSTGVGEVAFDRSKRWVFVPHFNVSSNAGEQIAKRRELRDMLERAAGRHGFGFFDPSPVVETAGRAAALDGNGADTFHYAPGFLPQMGQALYDAVFER